MPFLSGMIQWGGVEKVIPDNFRGKPPVRVSKFEFGTREPVLASAPLF